MTLEDLLQITFTHQRLVATGNRRNLMIADTGRLQLVPGADYVGELPPPEGHTHAVEDCVRRVEFRVHGEQSARDGARAGRWR